MGDPELVGVSWRLDYHCRSSTPRPSEPIFLIQFKLKDPNGEIREEAMEMTLAQIKDCHFKVSEAINSLKKL